MAEQDLDNAVSLELARKIHEAFSRLSRRLRALDLPDGLTNERLSTLASVRVHEPVSISALADAEVVSLPTMSRMVAALERERFVRRRANKSDGREVLISTTAKGKRAYRRATQRSLDQLRSTLSTLEAEQLSAISTLLSTINGPELSEQENGVERLYAIAPVGLCYFDAELRFRYINEWLARINGISVEAHLGRTVDDVLKGVATDIVSQLRHVLDTGEPIIEGEAEVETAAHPGELRHYKHDYYPDKCENGTVLGVSCVVQDVTDRKLEDTAQREEREDLRSLVEERAAELRIIESRFNGAQRLAKIGNWDRDLATNEVWWSDECYQLIGRTPETFKPSRERFLELVHPEDRERVRQTSADAIAAGEPFVQDYRLVLPDGSVKNVIARSEVIVDQAGRAVRIAGTIQDVTARVALELEDVATDDAVTPSRPADSSH